MRTRGKHLLLQAQQCAHGRIEEFEATNVIDGHVTSPKPLKVEAKLAHFLLCQVVDRLSPNGRYAKAANVIDKQEISSKPIKVEAKSTHLLLCQVVDQLSPNGRCASSKPLTCPTQVPRLKLLLQHIVAAAEAPHLRRETWT